MVAVLLIRAGPAAAAVYEATCPGCGASLTNTFKAGDKRVRVTGSHSVNDGYVADLAVSMKCHCGEQFTAAAKGALVRRVVAWEVRAAPEVKAPPAKEVKAEPPAPPPLTEVKRVSSPKKRDG